MFIDLLLNGMRFIPRGMILSDGGNNSDEEYKWIDANGICVQKHQLKNSRTTSASRNIIGTFKEVLFPIYPTTSECMNIFELDEKI